MNPRLGLLFAAGALLFIASPATADVVHLKNGGSLEGEVSEEGDAWRIDTGHGSIVLPKSDVAKIEKKPFERPAKPEFKRKPFRVSETFAHPFYGFKVYLPRGWQRTPSKEARRITFTGPKDGVYTPHIDLTVQVTRTELPDLVNETKKAYLKTYTEVTFPQEDGSMVRGRTAYQFHVAFSDGPSRTRSIWTLVRWEDRTYMMGFSCLEAWFDKYHDAVDACMRSLRLFSLPKASEEKRKEFERHYLAGLSAVKEGKTTDALKSFARAAELVPEYPEIHGMLGQLYVKSNRLPDAERTLRKAIELDPEDYDFNYNLGVVLLRQQKFGEAVAPLTQAVASEPDMEPALTNLGVAHLGKDQHEKAFEVLEKGVRADPESVAAHYNFGIACEKTGRPKEAEAQFRETLKIDPKHQGAKDGLARLKK